MCHVKTIAVLMVLVAAVSSQAAVTITSDSGVPTPGLPGFKTFTLTAHANNPITAFNFVGDGNNDPATGLGFFGPMNQVHPFGLPWIFDNYIPGPITFNPLLDSHFLVSSAAVVVPPGLAEEGPNILQAAWAWSTPQSNSIPFVQIVTAGQVCYRGQVTTFSNGTNFDDAIQIGCVGVVPEPSTSLLLVAAAFAALPTRRR
jgi:hypothetical protein